MSITAPQSDESVQDSHPSIYPKRLPIEVIDSIITEAAKSWGNHLKVYSRVCWEWNHICRPRLFSSMRVRFWDARNLSFLQFTAPHLFKYPQRLYVDCGSDYSSAPAPPWHADALGQFTNVSSLTLNTRRAQILPDARVPAIMRLLAKAPVRQLTFSSWGFLEGGEDLLHALSACSSTLEELTFETCHVQRGSAYLCRALTEPVNIGLPPVVRLTALRALKLRNGWHHHPQMHRLEMPNLRSLFCDYDEGDPFHHIWATIPGSLSELTLHIPVEVTPAVPTFSEHVKPSVLTIKLAYSMFVTAELDEDTLDEPRYPTYEDYRRLYRVLRPLRDGALRRVSLALPLYSHMDGRPEAYSAERTELEVAKLKDVFGPLLEGRVSIDVTITQQSIVVDKVVLKSRAICDGAVATTKEARDASAYQGSHTYEFNVLKTLANC
ncbi:F-box domain-containing protein [Pleurotus pulmonarius]